MPGGRPGQCDGAARAGGLDRARMTHGVGDETVRQVGPMTQDQRLTVRVIRTEAEWDAIRSQWDALYAACPSAAATLDFGWLRGWWTEYGAEYGPGGLRVVTVWRETRLLAALPLYVQRARGRRLGVRCLRFISTGEAEHEETCPEYLGLLCVPGEELECAAAVWAEVGRLDWDELELLDLDADSAFVRTGTVPPGVRPFSRGTCPVADLTGGFASYLDRLTATGRQRVRRLLRESEQESVTFEMVGADRLAGAYEDLVRLHQERWMADGKPGVFGAPRFVAFHRRLIEEWLPRGQAVLGRLSVGADPVVVLYGFVKGQKFDFYQSGMRREAAGILRSPGNLAHLLMMKALAERGVTAYDFLRGSSLYKERLATTENHLVGIHVWRRTVRATAYRSIRLAGRLVRGHVNPRTGDRE